MEMEQICEIVGKEYELKFSWTLKNMKSFDWVPSSYLESKRLEFKEINCSAIIRFYPRIGQFKILWEFNQAKCGNLLVKIYLGDKTFCWLHENEQLLNGWSDPYCFKRSLYNEKEDQYKFDFKFTYVQARYTESVPQETDKKISKFSEASEDEEFVVLDRKSANDRIVPDDEKQSGIYDSNFEVVSDEMLDRCGFSDSVSAIPPAGSIEIIEESAKTSDKSSSTLSDDDYDDDSKLEAFSKPFENLEKITLDADCTDTIIMMLPQRPILAEIIIHNFEKISDKEKCSIAKFLLSNVSARNFFDVIACAVYWNYKDLIVSVVEDFILKTDCQVILFSEGWKKLKTFPELYRFVFQLIMERFTKGPQLALLILHELAPDSKKDNPKEVS